MANYQELDSAKTSYVQYDSDSIIRDMTPSLRFQEEDKEIALIPFIKRLKKFSVFLIATSWILPLVSWFTGPYQYIFFGTLLIFLFQVIVGLIGFYVISDNRFERLQNYRIVLHVFFIGLLIFLLSYEIFGIGFAIDHNRNNCGDYDNNRVCKNRWGIMTEQMALIMVLPAVDVWIWIVYAYIKKLTLEFKVKLLQRNL